MIRTLTTGNLVPTSQRLCGEQEQQEEEEEKDEEDEEEEDEEEEEEVLVKGAQVEEPPGP